jgi:hypothetical protein
MLTALGLCWGAGAAQAAFDAADVNGPGGFVTACVTPNGSGVNIPATDLQPIMGPPGVGRCASRLFSGVGPAGESASQDAPTGSSSVAARLGVIWLDSRIDTPPAAGRPRSAASGGFADRLVIDSPGATGLPGHLVFHVGVQGLLRAAGTGGGAVFRLQAQVNDQDRPAGPGFDAGSGFALPATNQLIGWLASHERDEGFTAVAISEVVRFSVPFTFGQSFELGLWASVMTDTDYAGDSSRSVADFTPGVTWLGIAGAWVRETRFTTDLSLTAQSGVDWMQPVPEPSTALLAAAGALMLAWRLRDRRERRNGRVRPAG